MRETWFVLEDGIAVHPSEVSVNKNGRLAHKSGLVEMRGETPRSRGVDIDEKTGKQLFAGKGDHDGDDKTGGAKKPAEPAEPLTTDRQMKPAAAKPASPKKPYKTR